MPNFILFHSTVTCFSGKWGFWFLHMVQWWIWNFEKKSLKIRNSKFHNPQRGLLYRQSDRTAVKSVGWRRIISVVEAAFSENHKCIEWPQVTLNATRPKIPHICWSIVCEFQISPRFALRSLAFHIIKVFGFSIGYNGEFEIFEKKWLKIRNSKFQISQS